MTSLSVSTAEVNFEILKSQNLLMQWIRVEVNLLGKNSVNDPDTRLRIRQGSVQSVETTLKLGLLSREFVELK